MMCSYPTYVIYSGTLAEMHEVIDKLPVESGISGLKVGS